MENRLTFHILGYSHLPVSEKYMGCAFTQKIVKLTKMLRAKGHTVYVYGAEGSDVVASEFVQTHTLKDIRGEWGDGDNRFEIGYNWQETQFRHDFNTERTKTTHKFYNNATDEIRKRMKPSDFLLVMQGSYHRPIADVVGLEMTVEPGIGYRGSYCSYRAFESSYIQNFTYGSEHPRKSINGANYDRVIPNYYDTHDFEFSDEKKNYFLFMGRLIKRKGIHTAINTCKAIGAELIIAGQPDDGVDIHNLPDNCKYIGYADKKQRADLMAHAKAVFTPTEYLEPFGGVSVEAQLCGTPVISTNFGCFPENIEHGKTGFLCNTMQGFVDAATVCKYHKIDYQYIRDRAISKYSMDRVSILYQNWFNDLSRLYQSIIDPKVKAFSYIEGISE